MSAVGVIVVLIGCGLCFAGGFLVCIGWQALK